MVKTLVLEYDDLHWLNPENCISDIERFVSFIPNIKLSFFTPILLRHSPLWGDEAWLNKIKGFIESKNVELAVHGLFHTQEEFKSLSKSVAIHRLKIAFEFSKKYNVPIAKVFRGPHWGLNSDAVQALNELGFTHLYNHTDYKHLESDFNGKVIYYNWNLKDPAPPDDLLIAHGHTHDVCQNGIHQTFDKVMDFINSNEVEFKFVSEV